MRSKTIWLFSKERWAWRRFGFFLRRDGQNEMSEDVLCFIFKDGTGSYREKGHFSPPFHTSNTPYAHFSVQSNSRDAPAQEPWTLWVALQMDCDIWRRTPKDGSPMMCFREPQNTGTLLSLPNVESHSPLSLQHAEIGVRSGSWSGWMAVTHLRAPIIVAAREVDHH